MTEQDCLNALTGRTITKIVWQSPAEECLIIETHDRLKFIIEAEPDSFGFGNPYLTVSQIKGIEEDE